MRTALDSLVSKIPEEMEEGKNLVKEKLAVKPSVLTNATLSTSFRANRWLEARYRQRRSGSWGL